MLPPVDLTSIGNQFQEPESGTVAIKEIITTSPEQDSQTLVAPVTRPLSHQQLPLRQTTASSTSMTENGTSSSESSMRKSTQRSNSYDEATEDDDEVEIVIDSTLVPSERDNSVAAVSTTGSDNNAASSINHFGNGVTCRYYNRSRCLKGNNCPYSHGPDLYSLRSHPEGRNVCMYFIHNNKCRFKDSQCNYSHRRQDLTWNEEELKQQLAAKLEERKNHLRSKKDEHKMTKPRRATPVLPKPPLPQSSPQPQSLNKDQNKTPKGTKARNPQPQAPPNLAGMSTYPPRWEIQQHLDRLRLLQYGILNWGGVAGNVPPPNLQYDPWFFSHQ